MTVSEILKITAEYLGFYDLTELTELGGTLQSDEEQKNKLRNLITCLNDANQTLAFMYIPLRKTEKIRSVDGGYTYSQLSKPLIDILRVEDENGVGLSYDLYPDCFKTKSGVINVTYTYSPEFLSGCQDTVEAARGTVNKRLLAIGTVARYYLFQGMLQDAQAWENMFQKAILVATRKKGEVKIPKRRWM